jgi:hypothetical protein
MARITIDVDVRALNDIIAKLDVMPFVLEEEGRRAMSDSVELLRQQVEDFTPIGDSLTKFGLQTSGHLRNSIQGDASFGLGEMTGHVFTEVSYAPFVEEGHGEIRPKRPGGWLRFRPKGKGRYVYARKVRPLDGVFMFRHAVWASRERIILAFEEAMRRVARRMAGRP